MRRARVAVIGAGPAGMMAAGRAAALGSEVLLFEKNRKVGRKLCITGKGRCNLTNFCSPDEFITHLTSNERFLYSAINSFSCFDTIAFFEDRGLKTKVERGNRVFPVSDRASDVNETLLRYVEDSGVEIIFEEVKALLLEHGAVCGVKLKDREIIVDRVVIACGGLSYPATGSTGDGYRFSKAAGHSITALLPSLVSLVSDDPCCPMMQGLSLKNVGLTVYDQISSKEIYSDFGEMLFTHYGVSGPMILSASAHMRLMSPERYVIRLDLKPALDRSTLDRRLLKDLEQLSNRDMINALVELLPKRLIEPCLEKAGIDPRKKANVLTAEERKNLLDTLKGFSLSIRSFRPIDEAVVTAGGVDVKEIDPKTMQSKIVRGLYFAGEVMDLDAYTGGFNLQIAFSTGYLAGSACGEAINEA